MHVELDRRVCFASVSRFSGVEDAPGLPGDGRIVPDRAGYMHETAPMVVYG